MKSKVVEGLFYSKDHEWVKVEGSNAYIGITDHAQHALGEIVYVELPEVGDEFTEGETFGVIESVKAASDALMPVGGKILETNTELEDSPYMVNREPYESWIIKVELSDESQLENLMNAKEYQEFCDKEE
ncbi:glycine cleavage system protein GcvH [Alkaliphilus serpentinus]|uniref:Glycine cleavage system H protein n=1 Tax=Alkaliphilus serpentinus TaxID=1482731 RepID=A0A833MAK2_9FIRM|nr:glycine cleavage system protein GcvH [Alkaliphilus serpentinus]KAB3531134.1 glycine cleavage system protein GcvH [Alkaliphilus serpentinus]